MPDEALAAEALERIEHRARGGGIEERPGEPPDLATTLRLIEQARGFLALQEVHARGCSCAPGEACAFLRERDTARAEAAALAGALQFYAEGEWDSLSSAVAADGGRTARLALASPSAAAKGLLLAAAWVDAVLADEGASDDLQQHILTCRTCQACERGMPNGELCPEGRKLELVAIATCVTIGDTEAACREHEEASRG